MKKLSTLLLLSISVAASLPLAHAQTNYAGGTFTENFDGLPNTAVAPPAAPANGTVAPSPFSATTGTQVAVPGVTEFQATRASGTGTTAMPFVVDSGGGNTGGIYSYGASAGATDRALGTLASGGTVPAFGLELVNSGSTMYSSFTLSVNREEWRNSTGTVNTVSFSYFVGASGSTTFLTATGFTALTTFDLVSDAPVTTQSAQDGNANAITLTGTIPAALAPGQSLYVRWQDFNEVGNDAGLAIDSFSFAAVPEPSTYVTVLGSLALLIFALKLRRRTV